jgi:hypothetical protein
MAELYEEQIEKWYYTERDNVSLTTFLCDRIMLKDDEKGSNLILKSNIFYFILIEYNFFLL